MNWMPSRLVPSILSQLPILCWSNAPDSCLFIVSKSCMLHKFNISSFQAHMQGGSTEPPIFVVSN